MNKYLDGRGDLIKKENLLTLDKIKKTIKRYYPKKGFLTEGQKAYKSPYFKGILFIDNIEKNELSLLFYDYKWREDTFYIKDDNTIYQKHHSYNTITKKCDIYEEWFFNSKNRIVY